MLHARSLLVAEGSDLMINGAVKGRNHVKALRYMQTSTSFAEISRGNTICNIDNTDNPHRTTLAEAIPSTYHGLIIDLLAPISASNILSFSPSGLLTVR